MKITPKEKAKELVEKYAIWSWNETSCDYEVAKQCALIAVDEILNSSKENLVQSIRFHEYWLEVKVQVKLL